MRHFTILLVLFFLSGKTWAALLIEPVLGYNFATKADVEGYSNYTAGSGVGYGGRLGYQALGTFQVGLDYLASSVSFSDSDFHKNLDTQEWGAFAGIRFPLFVKVYAAYIFSATGTNKDFKSDKKLQMMDGSGAKVGVGFTGIPFVDINIEWRQYTFGDYKKDGTKQDKTVDVSGLFVGISVPLAI